MNILALEVSTSAAKALIYSTEDGVISAYSQSYKEKESDLISQEPEGIYQAAIASARKVIEETDKEIAAIGLGSTWHSILFLDQKRKPLSRIITWANTEAADTAASYRKDDNLRNWFYQKTGCVIHSLYPVWKWLHFKEQYKNSDQIFISSQPGYIFEKLTGEIAVSRSVASGTGFMNIHTLQWDEEILEFAGLSKDKLAPLRDPEYSAPLLKEAAAELGLPAAIPVIIPGPDGALNQIGSGALGKGIMTMSVGTSGAIRVAYNRPVLSDSISTWCYYAAEGKRLAGAAISGAGNCVKWFGEGINQEREDYQTLDKMAAEIEAESAPIFLPFLYGERCPGWQDQRRGGYLGLQGYHQTGDLYYSILEGVLFNLYQCYQILTEVGEVPSQIQISGGIENSPFWLQMAADIFQRDMFTSKVEHASTVGAAVMALKVMNEIDSLQEFTPATGRKITHDKTRVDFYQTRYEKYLDWYEKTLD